MTKTLELTFADGSRIIVEGSAADAPLERGFGDAIERVTEPFEQSLATLRGIADGVHATIMRAAVPPSAVSVTFGLNFSAESGVILAKGAIGANLEISMEWKKE